jgi:hypothetical protein
MHLSGRRDPRLVTSPAASVAETRARVGSVFEWPARVRGLDDVVDIGVLSMTA